MKSKIEHDAEIANIAAWLEPYRKTYLDRLVVQGYSDVVRRGHERETNRFCVALGSLVPERREVDGATVETLRHTVLNSDPEKLCRHARYRLGRFLDYLAKAGVISLPVPPVKTPTAMGHRDHAIMLLLGRLGLRAVEVVAIRLEDIDWRSGEILIRGKGHLQDRMPLPEEVGQAIVKYLRNGRRGTSRTLFVSDRAPHEPFKDAQIINYVLNKAFEKSGLKQPQKYVGSHLLRHSLATALLGQGASLEEVSHVLRHRSRATTAIYAKCDLRSLRLIAQAWPMEGGVR